eukprot:TRINITY_DN5604_c0_g2_i1.p1 TRINITY_DN5604_c0_g2~~TRINITY_DN5604_c0_g2_i1.p1  ORF type:complete len:351 (+),score=72.08 TRINITY_DN5604_c0_g2_i1:74-1126(+)
MKIHGRALLFFFYLASLPCAQSHSGYVFVSSPVNRTVYYAKLLNAAEQSRNTPMSLKTLLKGKEQVQLPLGLAVDNARSILYVADPGQHAVLAFRIFSDPEQAGYLDADSPVVVMSGVSAHWVAVNSVGTLFASDPHKGSIWTQSADVLRKMVNDEFADPTPTELYSQAYAAPVRWPQGLASDGMKLVWANGQDGLEVGAVARGVEDRGSGSGSRYSPEVTMSMSKDVDAAYGVCVTSSRIFFTGQENSVYSMRSDGTGRRVTITNKLKEPRGCAYDGDGTIFVADRKMGRVYSFAGGSPNIGGQRIMVPVMQVNDAFGVAVLSPSSAVRVGSFLHAMALAVAVLAVSNH